MAEIPSSGTSNGTAGDRTATESAAGSGIGTGTDTVVGELSALTEIGDGLTLQRFDIDLHVVPPAEGPCDHATSTVGSCCYFAPTPLPPTLPPGTSTGTPSGVTLEVSAGPLTLADATSNATIQTFDFQNGAYAHAPAVFNGSLVWTPGDALRVSAAGADIGAFTISAPTVLPPAVQPSKPIVHGQDVTFTWQPDPNAETLLVSIRNSGGGSVACTVPDVAGTVTMDASLLTGFDSSSPVQGFAQRQAVRYVQTPTGRIALKTFGWTPLAVSAP